MGQDAGLDFDKICEIGQCPKTVLPPRETERRSAARCHRRDDLLVLNDNFLEINFGKYRSVSCKSVRDRPKGIEGGLELNRASVYESSAEVERTRNGKKFERRRKIELPRGSDTSSCLSIVDSLCSSDEDIESNRSSVISRSSWATITSKCNCSLQPSSAEGLRQDHKATDNGDARCREPVCSFSKSLSVKVERPPLPFISESRRSSQSSSRTRFFPVKKMLNPLVKSKSLRSPPSHTTEDRAVSTTVTYPNHVTEQGKSTKDSTLQLHGILKRKDKQHGVPSFEFLLDCPEEALVAKTWKGNNVSDWVYTFHSLENRKKTFAEGMGSEDCHKESLMVGQMQVSGHISSEQRSDSGFNNSSVTEFVLYDTARVMRSTSRPPSRTSPGSVGRMNRVEDISSATKLRLRTKHDKKGRDLPLASAELGSELEVAAAVIQVPYAKRESFKYQRGDNGIVGMVHIVIPAGNHCSPNTGGSGPSTLLERWRAGGGCDCGGWDMACPLTILGNSSINVKDQILVDEDKPLKLLIQGSKDRIPALTMKFLQDGCYEIDFHPRLSSLQAFSICTAMLHSIETIKAPRDEDERNPRCGAAPEMLFKEESQFSVDPIRKMVNVPPSYVVKPPFSPIGRV